MMQEILTPQYKKLVTIVASFFILDLKNIPACRHQWQIRPASLLIF